MTCRFTWRQSTSNMCVCFFFLLRIARRDMAKRRHEQKNEEKNNAIRKRASEFKEKEKVRVTHGFYYGAIPLNRKMCIICSTGYYGYVPTVGKAAIWITITRLYTCGERVHFSFLLNQSFEGASSVFRLSVLRYTIKYSTTNAYAPWGNVTRRRKKRNAMHVMDEVMVLIRKKKMVRAPELS